MPPEMLALLEVPAALLIGGALLWLAAKPRRRRGKAPAPWRRHEQVVRALPDPEIIRILHENDQDG